MRHEIGWRGKAARRARDWDDRPSPEPKAHGPWEHLPWVALAAVLIGIAAGGSLIANDRDAYDRLMIGTGLSDGGSTAALPAR